MTTKDYALSIRVTPESGGYVAQCLDVDVASQGDTYEEALHNLGEALVCYIMNFGDEGIPKESPRSSYSTLDVQVPAYA